MDSKSPFTNKTGTLSDIKEHKSARSIGRAPSESVKKEDNVMNECEAAVAKYYKDMANLEQRLKE